MLLAGLCVLDSGRSKLNLGFSRKLMAGGLSTVFEQCAITTHSVDRAFPTCCGSACGKGLGDASSGQGFSGWGFKAVKIARMSCEKCGMIVLLGAAGTG